MAIVDDRGRVAGRVNLIDALVAVFLLILIPMGYGAYLLFRTPPARLLAINPKEIYQGTTERIGISGRNLRPFMRVSFGTTQAKTFLIGSTNFAAIDPPDLAPGKYDVVLYDYRQEVDRLKDGLTVLPRAPQPTLQMEVAGAFLYFGGPPITVGEKFPANGPTIAEVLAVGPAVPADMRVRTGETVIGVPLPGYQQIPATLRLNCSANPNPDGSFRCTVPGPGVTAVVAPDSDLTLPAPNGWINFKITEAYASIDPPLARARVSFAAGPAVQPRIKVGDTDTGIGANARGYAAKIVSIDNAGAGRVVATLQVPVLEAAGGWLYRQVPLKVGVPFTFQTRDYLVQGEVTDLTAPPPGSGLGRPTK